MGSAFAGASGRALSVRARSRSVLRRAIAEHLESRNYLSENPFWLGLNVTYPQTPREGDYMSFELDFGHSSYGVPDWISVGYGPSGQVFHKDVDFNVTGEFGTLAPLSVYLPDDSDSLDLAINTSEGDWWTFDPTVLNVAPVVTSFPHVYINEGSTAVVGMGLEDVNEDSGAFRFSFKLNPNELAADYASASNQGSATFGPFTEDGVYVVHGRGFDDESGYVDATTSIVVANVAPFATMGVSAPNSNGTVTATLTGANDPGTQDTVFKYSFSTNYNNLASSYSTASSGASATFTEGQLPVGTIIYARIFDNDNGYRNYSLGVTDMSVQVVSASQINLTWTDNVDDEHGWRVQRSTNGTDFTDYVNLDPGSDEYLATGLNDGTRYWFRVRAYSGTNNPGESIYSPKMAQTTYMKDMANVTATNLDNGQIIEVEWDAPTTSAVYDKFVLNVYRGGEDVSEGSLLKSVEVDALTANAGAGSYSHRFIDIQRHGMLQFSVQAMGTNGQGSNSPNPFINQPQQASVWHPVIDQYWQGAWWESEWSGDDLFEQGVVTLTPWGANESWQVFANPGANEFNTEAGFTLRGLPAHTKALVAVEVDPGFASGAQIVAKADNRLLPDTSETTAGSYNIQDAFSHSRSTLRVSIRVDAPPNVEGSWGITKLRVYIYGPSGILPSDDNPPVPDANGFNPPGGSPPPDPIYPGPDPDPDPDPEPEPIAEPDEEDDEEGMNFVNLIVGGWGGFWTQYAWPFGDPSFVGTYGSTPTGDGNPPSGQSVFIGVNDDFDEGNVDESDNLVPDNVADSFVDENGGHRVDWDVAPLYMNMFSTVNNPNDLGTFSLSYPTDKVKLWRPNPAANPGDPRWIVVGDDEVLSVQGWADAYATGNWQGTSKPVFLVEGIDASEQAHDVEIEASFTRGTPGTVKDKVRFTVFKTQFYEVTEQDELVPVEYSRVSHPTPVFSNVNISVSNLHLSSDSKRVLGRVSVSGALDDAASDLIEGAEGSIPQITYFINGAAGGTIGTTVSKTFDEYSILKPFDFGASFTAVLNDVELQPGANLIHLSAKNAYGLAGFAERSVEVLVTPPADQAYEYEVRITQDPYTVSSTGVTIELRTRVGSAGWGSWRTLQRSDANTFTETNGAVIDFVLSHTLDGTDDDDVWVTMTDSGTQNPGEVLALALDRIDSVGGVNKPVWAGDWTREEHHLLNLSSHTREIGNYSPITVSEGGEFHPLLVGLSGTYTNTTPFDGAMLGPVSYDTVLYDNRIVLGAPDSDLPRPFLSTYDLDKLHAMITSPVSQPDGLLMPHQAGQGGGAFALGLGAGMLQTIPDTVAGLWDGTKFVLKQAVSYSTPVMLVRWIRTGNVLTVDDQRRLLTAKGVATSLASVVQKLQTDQAAAVEAWLTGDDEALNALGEEYRVVFEFAGEMLEDIWTQIANQSDYEKGRIIGRIVGEVLLAVGTAGVGAALKGATMASVANKLKQVDFLSPLIAKFDELIVFYGKVDDWTDGLDGIDDGKVIAQRALSYIIRMRKPDEGWWQAFEKFLDATDAPARKAMVDSHLMFIVNRVMRESYKEAADIIRGGGTLAQAMEKVPTITRINNVMSGRRATGFLESHHTATKKWMRELAPGITDNDLDSMPALVLDKAWHRQFNNSELPRDFVFHNILKDRMVDVDPGNAGAVIERLRQTYRQFFGAEGADPDPDEWIVIKKWIDEQLD